MHTHRTMCRICTAHCAVLVDVEDDRPVAVRGDKSNGVYEGFLCVKGREFANAHTHPKRLLRTLRRVDTGQHEAIPSHQAIDEIATRLQRIVDRDGPNAVAGLVSISHAWGENPDVEDPEGRTGSNTGRLMSVEVDYDPYSGIPRMSALPVNVAPLSLT